MLATADSAMATDISRQFESHPESSRMADIQAALGISQLNRYGEMLRRRIELAGTYLNALPKHSVRRIKPLADRSIFFRFPLSVDAGFDAVADKFQQAGIQVRRGVDSLLHRKAGLPDSRFPFSAELFRTTVSLPLYPSLSENNTNYILSTAQEILG